MNNTEERMNEILKELGKKYNYDSTNAQYIPFNDFKIKWRRTYRWIEFDISDFLMDVPENVFSGILEYTFRKIVGIHSHTFKVMSSVNHNSNLSIVRFAKI